MSVLDSLNMPIDEFMYAVNDFHGDELSELLIQIRTYVIRKDVIGLRKFLISYSEKLNAHESFYELNLILIKIHLQTLANQAVVSEEEVTQLTDYLFSVEYWGNYELHLFLNTIDILTHKMLMSLSRKMLSRSEIYREIKIKT